MRIAMQKNALILALFAITCTAIVGLVNVLTKDKIAQQERLQLLSTLQTLIAPERYNNEIALDCVILANDHIAYLARLDDIPVAAAITTTASGGYNGNIELLVAINIDNSISGIRILKHNETPGLGDKIEYRKSNWVDSFIGKTVESDNDSRWQVQKDGGMYDQFTGATITPRAVVKAVKQSALYFAEHKQSLFSQPNACRGTNDNK